MSIATPPSTQPAEGLLVATGNNTSSIKSGESDDLKTQLTTVEGAEYQHIVTVNVANEFEPANPNPHTFEWRSLSYEVAGRRRGKNPGGRKILQNVSGSVSSGEMVAIMGSSGAGKTTLLNCLSGRVSTGKLTGRVLLDGQPRNPRLWRRQAAFVEQDDVLYQDLTVRETIEYAARLRLPSSENSPEDVKARAEAVIRSLRLSTAAETRVGNTIHRGISGGERKRTAIAQEFVTMPEILFLDEPTSGLDSNTSLHLMDILKSGVVSTGRIAIATLHQPSWELLSLFNKIVLLSAGSTVFFGPPADAVVHFAKLNFHPRPNQNPADFFMDLLTIDTSKPDEGIEEDKVRVQQLQEAHRTVQARDESDRDAEASKGKAEPADALTHDASSSLTRRWPNPWLYESRTLTERAFKQLLRGRAALIAGLVRTFLLLVLIGFTYFRIPRDQRGISNRQGILYFWPINVVLMNLIPIVNLFPTERAILRRERSAGAYRTSSFFAARLAAECSIATVWSLLGSVPLYFLLGLRADAGDDPARHVFVWALVQWTVAMTALAYGLVVAVLVPTLQVGQIVAPLVALTFMIFGGGVVSVADQKYPLKLIQWISPLNYAYRANLINEFQGPRARVHTRSRVLLERRPGPTVPWDYRHLTVDKHSRALGACIVVLHGRIRSSEGCRKAALHTYLRTQEVVRKRLGKGCS
ncbi:P-loop containing nucleoside triphosphate hydrolase protein [Zopfochytrium polystomum]|nr:P-loop containing nucleoside triphosphate hydrolase protein [Zopfochytrium polystomum]